MYSCTYISTWVIYRMLTGHRCLHVTMMMVMCFCPTYQATQAPQAPQQQQLQLQLQQQQQRQQHPLPLADSASASNCCSEKDAKTRSASSSATPGPQLLSPATTRFSQQTGPPRILQVLRQTDFGAPFATGSISAAPVGMLPVRPEALNVYMCINHDIYVHACR